MLAILEQAMRADIVFENISQLVSPTRTGLHRGEEQGQIQIIPDALLAVGEGKVVWVGARRDWDGQADTYVDLGGRAVVPGLIDPHTHAMWAGDRLNDFEARAQSIPYEQILRQGGGIYHTVRQVVRATPEQLIEQTLPRVHALLRSGVTTIEIKSGYGIEPEVELKMLRALRTLPYHWNASFSTKPIPIVVSTLLIHVPPRAGEGIPLPEQERRAYLQKVCDWLIPTVAQEGLAEAVDIFVEKEAFSVAEAEQVLRSAQSQELKVKLHADQFHALGGVELGVRLGALSVDHMEASGEAQIRALAHSRTVATILPGVSLHLGLPPAPGRALIDAGAGVAVGTDLNPGSSPLFSMQLALALAVRLNGLTLAEALVAGTVNAAAALGLSDRGALVLNARADFVVLESPDWRDLLYTLGGSIVRQVYIQGREAL